MAFQLLASIQAGIRSLRSNPLRTLLSTLGVIIGVASLVAILSIGDTLERFSREQIEQTTDLQTLQVSPVTTDLVDGIRVRRDTVFSLSPAFFMSIISCTLKAAVSTTFSPTIS